MKDIKSCLRIVLAVICFLWMPLKANSQNNVTVHGVVLDSDSLPVIGASVMVKGSSRGVPTDLDLLFDVRCFHNPYYIPALKPLTGLDAPVRDFVLSAPETRQFVEMLFDMISHLLPLYRAEGKTQLTVGIGCTGGQHRSVAINQALAEYLHTLPIVQNECTVNVVHRDIGGKK